MKILHIAEFGLRKTGIGTVVERLYKEQSLLGHDVKIATTNENIAYKHLDITNVHNPENLTLLLDEWTPDAVMFHSIWCMPYIKMAKILKERNIPYAVMMHGANSADNFKKNKLKKWVANTLYFNKFMRYAATIVYLSKKEHENCVSKNVNPNYAIIPNGCDIVDIDVSKKLPNKPLKIIYLGRLIIHHKGLDYLLDALDILKQKKFTDAIFQFYGNENDVDIEIIKERLNSLKGLASYEGPAYGEKKTEVLANADAFILTSRYEGMPMGVLEALTYGVPCILTPGTNMAEDVVEAGAGWEADMNAQDIADTILQAVADLKLNHFKHNQAAYNMSKRYDWEIIARQHSDMMEKIVVKNIIEK